MQPVVLRKFGDRYQLVAGERRWRAAKKAGFQRIPAVVRSYEDKAMLELALIENLQRQNLNPIETARAYRRLIDEYSYTQEDLGKRMGRSRSAIANTLRLLALADPVQEMLASGALTEGQARPLLAEPPEIQEAMASDIANRGLTARQVERMTSRRVVSRETSSVIDPHRADAIERLQHRLGTAVRISGADKGELAIRFYSLDDLNRVIDLILNTEEGLN